MPATQASSFSVCMERLPGSWKKLQGAGTGRPAETAGSGTRETDPGPDRSAPSCGII